MLNVVNNLVVRCQYLQDLVYTRYKTTVTAIHEMQTIVTDDRGVCPSVCYTAELGFTVQKRLSGSRSFLE